MKRSGQLGITLLEILVTIAILSVLSALAAPSVQALIQKNRARAIADEFTSSLYQARSEAVKRNHPVTLCASNADQDDCDASAVDLSDGWIVFTDYDRDQIVDPPGVLFDTTGDGANDTAERVLQVSGVPAGNIEITANVGVRTRALTYRSTGLVDGQSLFSYLMRDTASGDQVARIYVSLTGKIRQCIGDTTQCP